MRIEGVLEPAAQAELLGRIAVKRDREHAWISEQIRIFACASDAASQNKLDPEMLRASEARLDKGYPKAASIPSPADARPIGE